MALTKRGGFSYGQNAGDIRLELADYAQRNGYEISYFADPVCACGSRVFILKIDDNEGAAVRECCECAGSHAMGDSAEYLQEARLEECECLCGAEQFELSVGVALYDQSDAVRWIYIGCRCPGCGLIACYADWKNEFEDYRELIAKI